MSRRPDIYVHIGLPECGGARLQDILDEKRALLAKNQVLIPRSAGRKNHTRLYMAVSDPDHIDPLRWHRGHADLKAQDRLRQEVTQKLAAEIEASNPQKVIISATQLAWLSRPSELQRLFDLLAPMANSIRIVAHVEAQARVALRNYAEQVFEGRQTGLDEELELSAAPDWFDAAIALGRGIEPAINAMPEVQSPPFWLDYPALLGFWQSVFGPTQVTFLPYDEAQFHASDATKIAAQAFDIDSPLGNVKPASAPEMPSAETLARARQINQMMGLAMQTGLVIPRQLRRRLLGHTTIEGPAIADGALHPVSTHFTAGNKDLVAIFPQLKTCLTPPKKAPTFVEPAPTNGFRASQYMAAFLPRLKEAHKTEAKARARAPGTAPQPATVLPKLAQQNYAKLSGGRFAPHNDIGRVNEAELAAPYTPTPPRKLPKGSSGNVVVGCMKNEGPYIIEWVAYHRAIGIDNFLIYTNGCDDGTSEILDRLQELGMVQHRNNDKWRGNSPQQFALNQSLKEPVIKNAEWIIHIDVDEFINVRTGNGTLPEFLAMVPEATNVAMTWRLFGNNMIDRFVDAPVIGQFDTCAPKYCPKPHTVWGFKTMMKNIGAYDKISCHRPNKLREERREDVVWVNGSGQVMKPEIKDKGWRSEVKTIGYDLIQLNHYALRSADSFLIKRQRGRALHVDRSIGLNYWIRMDWSDHKDLTIQRNLPRLRAEMARLLQDTTLARLHDDAVSWHQAKAAELHQNPEFQDLYRNARDMHLDPMERVAYALALDMES